MGGVVQHWGHPTPPLPGVSRVSSSRRAKATASETCPGRFPSIPYSQGSEEPVNCGQAKS